jgi:hypothetical protein
MGRAGGCRAIHWHWREAGRLRPGRSVTVNNREPSAAPTASTSAISLDPERCVRRVDSDRARLVVLATTSLALRRHDRRRHFGIGVTLSSAAAIFTHSQVEVLLHGAVISRWSWVDVVGRRSCRCSRRAGSGRVGGTLLSDSANSRAVAKHAEPLRQRAGECIAGRTGHCRNRGRHQLPACRFQ